MKCQPRIVRGDFAGRLHWWGVRLRARSRGVWRRSRGRSGRCPRGCRGWGSRGRSAGRALLRFVRGRLGMRMHCSCSTHGTAVLRVQAEDFPRRGQPFAGRCGGRSSGRASPAPTLRTRGAQRLQLQCTGVCPCGRRSPRGSRLLTQRAPGRAAHRPGGRTVIIVIHGTSNRATIIIIIRHGWRRKVRERGRKEGGNSGALPRRLPRLQVPPIYFAFGG